MTSTTWITNLLDEHAQRMESTAKTLENASKRIREVTERDGNIPLETVSRSLLPLGFCVVHKDALSTAIQALKAIDETEQDVIDDELFEAFEKARQHLRDALTGF